MTRTRPLQVSACPPGRYWKIRMPATLDAPRVRGGKKRPFSRHAKILLCLRHSVKAWAAPSSDCRHFRLTRQRCSTRFPIPVFVRSVCMTGDSGMRVKASIVALALAALSGSAFGGQIQSSDDIVKFFAGQVNLGASRGICIGTEDECRSKKAEAAPPKGLDMLVNFDLDSASLTPDARAKLEEFAKALKDDRLRKLDFRVEGYTDASGSEVHNEKLSAQR